MGERRVTPADVGVVEEDAADPKATHEGFQTATGIGDSDEVLACGFETEFFDSMVEEVFEEGEGFDRAAGFGGNNIEGMGGVEGAGVFEDIAGMGAVEDMKVERVELAEDFGEDFRGEAGATHAEKENICKAFAGRITRLDFGSEAGKVSDLGGHIFRTVQPAKTVSDFVGGVCPDGVVVRPDPRGDIVCGQ